MWKVFGWLAGLMLGLEVGLLLLPEQTSSTVWWATFFLTAGFAILGIILGAIVDEVEA